VVAVLATGCQGDQPPTKDQVFIDALVENQVIAAETSDEAKQGLVEQGRGWCEQLRDPATTRAMLKGALADMVASLDQEMALKATATMGLAAQTYCPEAAARFQ
jgi:hypothetical protein